jgi:hypothetical protein
MKTRLTDPVLRIWLLFGGLSLGAVLIGGWTAHAHGVAPRSWGLNISAWGLGAGSAALMARRGKASAGWLYVTLAVLCLTLVSPGLNGVHRWVTLGPLRLNGAELLMPVAVTALASQGAHPALRWVFPPIALAILALQPDTSQATATAGAAIVVLGGGGLGRRAKALLGIILTAGVVLAALRPDPLAPVPEVEDVIQLAAALSPGLAALAVAALAGAALAPLVSSGSADPSVRFCACGLTAYFVLSAAAPLLGAFPVPLVGMGVSPILGGWLGIGGLMGLMRNTPQPLASRP